MEMTAPAPPVTHAIASVLPAVGTLPESVTLHAWGTEDEMMDLLTDPNLPRQYCRHLDTYVLRPATQADVDAELAQRAQDQAHQRAHSWAM